LKHFDCVHILNYSSSIAGIPKKGHAYSVLLWKSCLHPPLTPQSAPLLLPHLPISLPNFSPCFPSFSLVTCHRHSSYLAPCATLTCYRATLHRHDSSSATPSSALYIQLLYLLYLVRFKLVGLYTACTSHIPLISESDPSLLCLCALVLRHKLESTLHLTLIIHLHPLLAAGHLLG